MGVELWIALSWVGVKGLDFQRRFGLERRIVF